MRIPAKYYLLNGQLVKSAASDNPLNMSDWLTSPLCFHWRSSGSRIPFYEGQYDCLRKALTLTGHQTDSIPDKQLFHNQLSSLIQKNRLFKGVHLRICINFPSAPSKDPDLLCLCEEYPDDEFHLNSKGLQIAVAEHPFPGQAALWRVRQAGFESKHWKQEAEIREVDLLVYTNTRNHLLNSVDARIYLIKGGKIFTPDYQELDHWGIEKSIMRAVQTIGLELVNSSALVTGHLQQADEVFIANDFQGIRWVMGCESKRYFRKYAPRILQEINTEWATIN